MGKGQGGPEGGMGGGGGKMLTYFVTYAAVGPVIGLASPGGYGALFSQELLHYR